MLQSLNKNCIKSVVHQCLIQALSTCCFICILDPVLTLPPSIAQCLKHLTAKKMLLGARMTASQHIHGLSRSQWLKVSSHGIACWWRKSEIPRIWTNPFYHSIILHSYGLKLLINCLFSSILPLQCLQQVCNSTFG